MSGEKVLDNYSEEIDKAYKEIRNNNLDKAESICHILRIKFPDAFKIYYLLGYIYLNRGKHAEALEQYSIALGKDREKIDGGYINYWIGRVYDSYSTVEQKNPLYDSNKAKQYYYKAKGYENYPSDVIFRLEYEYKGAERIKLYEEGIKKFPDETVLYIYLSRGYYRLKNIDKALEILTVAYAKGIKTASLCYNIGDFYFNNGQFHKARELFFESLILNKENLNSNYALDYAIANSYYKENDYTNAEKYYRKSYEENINSDTCWFGFFGLIIVYNDQKKFDEIEKLINEITIDKTNFFEHEMLVGDPFWLDSRLPESITLIYNLKKISSILRSLKISKKQDTLLGKYWLIRTLIAKCIANHKDRYNSLKNVLKYFPSYEYEFLYKELCLIYSDLFDQKIERKQDINNTVLLFKTDLENYSTSFKTYAVEIIDSVVNALFATKKHKDIVEIYRFFNEEQIAKAGVWFEVGYSLAGLKEHKEAKKAYEKHIESRGESSATLNNLANIYKLEDNLQKAIDLYKRALAFDSKDEVVKGNLERTLKQFESIENEKNQQKVLDVYFKSALKSVKEENNFVLDKLNKFILNIKKDENFKNWSAPIQKYKFPILMGTDKQKAESLRLQWLNKNYIKESDSRDEHNVVIYFINPYIEKEIPKINNNKIPENWIDGFANISIGRLEEIGYFELINRIIKANKKFRPLLERDFNELVFNYIVKNEKATIIMSGSLVELVLTYYCEKKKITQISYVDSGGNTINKKLYDCVLNDLIQYAEKKLFFGSDFPYLSNLSRIYRNYIHPGRELKGKLDKSKSDLCFISATEILKKIL